MLANGLSREASNEATEGETCGLTAEADCIQTGTATRARRPTVSSGFALNGVAMVTDGILRYLDIRGNIDNPFGVFDTLKDTQHPAGL